MITHLVEAMELAPTVAVHSMDANRTVRFWNAGAAQMFGVAPDEAVGRPIAGVLPFVREAEHDAVVDEVWRSGKPGPARDWQVRTRDGRVLWIYSASFPLIQDGVVRQVFCMDIDVTERKRNEAALENAGAHFRQMYLKSSDAILLIGADSIAEVNPAALALFKCGAACNMVGRPLSDFAPLRQPGGALSSVEMTRAWDLAHDTGNFRCDWRYLNCAGELFWAEVLMTSIALNGEHLFYVVVRDITARKQAEHRLHLAAQVFENSRDAIIITDREQTVIAVNRAYSNITGRGAGEMLGQPLARQVPGLEDPALNQDIRRELDATGHWQGEIHSRRAGGDAFPAMLALTAIRDSNGAVSNYMGILSDITDRKKTEEHTRHLAEHDFLTDLPNRVLLLDRLSQALQGARRSHRMLALMFIDLDRFKEVNDTLGHQVGDELLKEIARRLVKCVRGADTVSRQGGDEFLIILADIGGVDQAAHVAGTVLNAIAQPFRLGVHTLQVSGSIGIAIYPNDGDDIEQLIKHADVAMYHVKEGGRNGYQFFNADMQAQIAERVALEEGLRRALRNQEFELEFQAELDVLSGDPVGMEALVRWRHPELGLLLPERFMAVAEDAGLMIPIGTWVLQQACRHARRWREGGHPLVVAVNLSTQQFTHKNLLGCVREALEGSGLSPEYLELELTEAIIMKGGAAAQGTLLALSALGVRLTIDDFGTGYSRLGYLKDYPVDKLKIDSSFTTAGDGAVVATIIAMARNLKMQVIAEGVETGEQLAYLRSKGCDQYQGRLADAQLRGSALAPLLH
ncbi:PAS domain S-box-containing protein/diguanylate cyclase (GGDEF) domain-containing protein [Pseudoduganella namucuonensis]|uniref:PAS domain S-box-containing protein/diguanylate cyclase (GGDEF) domain-containing protein n=2 Tax=Pseudoduganella namucuonensis TaxID=1035707 RepID=A0A1I7FV34_9BURK|nr:PAS domain S-box-containing protein/diguanylate cyclase (GGDEF) domain-containing protein [Pseudoduganella namucuonensis]